MASRERVLSSLNHKQPDKIAIDFGATAVTGMHVNIVASLREYYGLEKRLVKVHEPYQMLGYIDDDLKEILGVDVEGIFPLNTIFGFPNENWKEWKLDSGLEVLVSEHFNTTKDDKGDTLIYPEGDTAVPPSGRMPKNGYFFDCIVRQEPIDEEKLNPEDNLEEYGLISDEELDYFSKKTKRASAKNRAVVLSIPGTALGDIALVPAPFIKHPKGIRDIEEWYMSTMIRPDYIHKVFEKQTEIALENLAKIKDAVKDNVDAVFICGTDFGTQNSTFCSEETYNELYKPYYKQINGWIHSNTEWKTFKHTCGAVKSLVPALIESGFDILNPVQVSAFNMDAKILKEEFGEQLTFWGGGVDTQDTLAFKTPKDVREEVLKHCRIFNKNGGYIFNTVHNIQGNTPIENVVALFDAVKSIN
ncbi:MAG: hypothetical protein L3J41_14070 [Melioribacteraceae bacterium]|nr:hypothetical protein [Melioribacteraceae bacterium]